MLAEKLEQHQATAWLLNTGWVGGAKGKRYCMPNTMMMLHHPSGTARGQASDMVNEKKELFRVRARFVKHLAEQTGNTKEVVAHDLCRDNYFSPQSAQKYGLIDHIMYPSTMNSRGS